jgi:hypothetical protein
MLHENHSTKILEPHELVVKCRDADAVRRKHSDRRAVSFGEHDAAAATVLCRTAIATHMSRLPSSSRSPVTIALMPYEDADTCGTIRNGINQSWAPS